MKERYRDRDATYPALVDLYLHILDDSRFWFVRAYTAERSQDYPLGTRLSRAEAERATHEVDRLVGDVLKRLRPSVLDRKILQPMDRKPLTIRSMLLQRIEGGLELEGELNGLLWQMDVTPPAIDLA